MIDDSNLLISDATLRLRCDFLKSIDITTLLFEMHPLTHGIAFSYTKLVPDMCISNTVATDSADRYGGGVSEASYLSTPHLSV